MRQGGVLSPQLFAIHMNDLSGCLTQCKAGCHLNETVTNHVMYADDICLMAPSAIALQKMLNLCYEFSLSNDIIFNPTKSQCMVFKPNRFKLYCPAVYLNGNIIDYVEKTKYLRYMFTNDKQDDVEMLRQLRLLYMRSNKIICMFYFCTIAVNPIRSGLFQTVNDPGGGGFKSPPLRSRKLLCQSSPYHTCEIYQVFLA